MNDQNNERKALFFLKSMKKRHVEETIKKGKFCFNHPSVFNRWETTTSAQHDRWDAYSSHVATHLVFAPIIGEKDGIPVYGKAQKIADKGIVRLQSYGAQHTPICCFRIIEENETVRTPEGTKVFLGEIAEKILSEFGHDAFVLIEAAPFLERLTHKYTCLTGGVIYKDTTNDYEFKVPDQYKDVFEQLFRKDERFAWQKEFRIALPPSQESPVFIELGSIEDIAISGMLSDFLN